MLTKTQEESVDSSVNMDDMGNVYAIWTEEQGGKSKVYFKKGTLNQK